MFVYRLFLRLTRVPYFLLLLLHLFGGSTWNINRRDGGGGRGGDGGRGGGGFARGQEFPSRDEGHFQFMVKHPEVVFDTKSLPDGKEETIYLDKGKPTRFFFIVEEDAAILNLIVSPCSSRISWTFSYLYPTPNEGHDEGQDLEEEKDEIFQQGKPPHSSSISSNRNSSRLLKSYTGNDVSEFESENPDAGIYSLLLVNEDRDGSVRLFASTSPPSVDYPFPLLPDDRKVRIISSSSSKSSSRFPFPYSSSSSSSSSSASSFSSSSSSSSSAAAAASPPSPPSFSSSFRPSSKIHLAWKRSPTEAWHRQPIEYCLSVNNFRHLKTYCAARTLALGDPRPTLPPNAGFGGTHQDQSRGTAGRRMKQNGGGRKLRKSKQRVWLVCVGSKTSFTFKVSPSAMVNGRTFYFDVFAVNRHTQSSVAYEGVQLKPVVGQQVKLKLDEVVTVRLKAPSDYMLFRLKVMPPLPKVLLFGFRACVGLVRVEISRDNDDDEILYENRTIEGRPLQFMARTSATSRDSYVILISNDGKGSASFQASVTSAETDFPFPDIPENDGIRVIQSDCNSLELSWMESNPGQTYYCLVVEPLHHSTGGSALNRCVIPRPSSDNYSRRILCHPTSSQSNPDHPKQQEQHYQTVTDLESDLFYRLTVFVGYRNSNQFYVSSYRPTIADTTKECRSEIDRNNTEIRK